MPPDAFAAASLASASLTKSPAALTLLIMLPEEVKAVRYKLKQTQAEFAMMIGVSVNTLQSWEEGKHHPDGPAQALLRIAAKSPKMVVKILGRA